MSISQMLVEAIAYKVARFPKPDRGAVQKAAVLVAGLAGLGLLSGCGGTIDAHSNYGNPDLTQGQALPQYPDDKPSVPDGKIVWDQQNCASCHGATGSGGSAKVSLADLAYGRSAKPVDQFMVVAYGIDPYNPKKPSNWKHPGGGIGEKATLRQMWNLVFYLRSLSVPPLSDKEIGDIDAVFGSNCVVCHGKKGYGDGPLAHNLEPQPANFQTYKRFYDRTDDILWDHIANGIKWEGMPNFRGKTDKIKNVKFDDPYIWKLVGYIRHFQETTIPTVKVAENPASNNAANGQSPAAENAKGGQNQSSASSATSPAPAATQSH